MGRQLTSDSAPTYTQPFASGAVASRARTAAQVLQLVAHGTFLVAVVSLAADAYITLPPGGSGVFLSQVLTLEAALVLLTSVAIWRIFVSRTGASVSGIEWKAAIPLCLISLVAFISIAFAHSRGVAEKDALKTLIYIGLFLLALSARTIRQIDSAGYACAVGYLLVTLGAFATVLGTQPDLATVLLNIQHTTAALQGNAALRMEATFRYPNELAAYLLIVMPLTLAFLVRVRTVTSRVALSSALGTGLILLYRTYTRGAIVACVLVIVFLLFLLVNRRIAFVVSALALVGFVALLLHGGASSARLASIFDLSSAGYGDRSIAWRWALQTFLHHPLFGVGLGNLAVLPGRPYYGNPAAGLQATDAENMYLNVAAELGVVGFICFAGALILALRRTWHGFTQSRRPLDQAWNAGALGALVGVMIYGMVDPIVVSGQVTGILCVVIGLSGSTLIPSPRHSESVGEFASLATVTHPQDMEQTPEAMQRPLSRRLVFLVNGPGLGGANRHSLNLAQRLHALGARVLIVVPPGAIAGIEAQHMGLPVRELAMGMNIGRWRGYLGTLSLLNVFAVRRSLGAIQRLHSEEPTLFICPHPREQLLTAWLAPRHQVKAIWVAHSPFHYPAHRLLINPLWIRASRSAEAVVAVSRGFALALRRAGIGAGHLYSIPNAVEVSVPQQNWGRVARTPYLIGVAARLVKGKGIQYLIDAMPGIVERYPLAHLAIAGSGRYEPALRARVRRLGLENHVTFAGHIQNMPNFYRSLHVFVLPSLSEVLPTVVLEAAIAETAVVATDVGSTAEGMAHGATGLLVKPADVAGLRRAIMRLLDDPDEAIAFGRAGHQFVARQFDMQRVSAAFYALAQQIEQRSLPAASAPEDEAQPGTLEKATPTGQLGTTNAKLVAATHRRGLLGRSGIVLASKLTTAVATACWTIIASRALLPSAYGNLALVAGIVDLGAYLGDAGLQSVAARELASATHEEMRHLLGSTIYLKLLLGIVSTGVLFILVFTLPFGGQADQVMLALGPSMLFASFNTMTLVFRARSALAYLFAVSAATAVVGIGTTLVAYFLHGDVFAYAQAQFAAAVVSSLLLFIMIVWRFSPSLRPNLRQITHLLKTAAPLGFSSALVVMYYRLDVPILGLLANSVQVAMYSNAYRFLDMLALVPASLGAIALPQMSALRRQGLAVVANYCQRYLEIAIILGSLLGMLLSFTAPHLLDLLYGRRYDAATPVLQVLAWAGAATFLTNALSPIAIVLQRSRAMIIIAASGLVVNLTINIVLIPQFGALAAAYATLVTEIVVILGFGWVGVRALSWRIHLLLPLGAVIATGVCEYLIMALATQPIWARAPWPVTAVILFFAWSLCFAPFGMIHSARSRRAQVDAQAAEAPPETMERRRSVTNSVWLMAGMLPAPVWTLLANLTQPALSETDANAETEPELPRSYQQSDDAFRERQSDDPRDWSSMQ